MLYIKTNKQRSLFSLVLLLVFAGSLLIKPAHIFLSAHNHAEETINIQHQQQVSTNHYEHCAILDFEFCLFISSSKIAIPEIHFSACKSSVCRTTACLATSPTYLFQLRAPPVAWFFLLIFLKNKQTHYVLITYWVIYVSDNSGTYSS